MLWLCQVRECCRQPPVCTAVVTSTVPDVRTQPSPLYPLPSLGSCVWDWGFWTGHPSPTTTITINSWPATVCLRATQTKTLHIQVIETFCGLCCGDLLKALLCWDHLNKRTESFIISLVFSDVFWSVHTHRESFRRL